MYRQSHAGGYCKLAAVFLGEVTHLLPALIEERQHDIKSRRRESYIQHLFSKHTEYAA